MKWSLDLAIAAALTVVVWAGFYFTFPSRPLNATETIFVLVVFYVMVKLVHLAWQRWGPAVRASRK